MRYKEGLTPRSFLAIIYGAFILQPIIIFTLLYAGASIIGAVQYLVILVFTEIARLYGSRLTKQEVFIAFYGLGAAASGGVFISLLFKGYLRTSSITRAFGIADKLPVWVAPPSSSEVYFIRTLFHPDWLPALSILLLGMLLFIIADLGIGMLVAQMYVEVEKLPFPLAQVSAQAIITLTERPAERLRIFVFSIIIGMIYGVLLYAIPIVGGIQAIPYPWADANEFLETKLGLYGASFGVATDLVFFATGFVIPFTVAVSQFIGAMTVWFIGNMVILKMGLWPSWLPGMKIQLAALRSALDFWASPTLGLIVAAAIMPLILHPRYLSSSIKSLSKLTGSSREAGFLPLWILLALYIVGSFGSVGLTLYLVPGFMPYWWTLILLGPIWSFIYILVSARSIGETGYQLPVPYFREGLLVFVPYKGVDIWFAPIYTPTVIGGISSVSGQGWASTVKIAELTETKISSVLKTWIIATALAIVMSYIYTSAFWMLAPVPSSYYPATIINWPISAMYTGLWVSKKLVIFRPTTLVSGFIIGSILFAIQDLLHLPFSYVGFVIGAANFIPISVSTFIGALIDRTLLVKIFGKEKWRNLKSVAVAGLLSGEGIILGFSAIWMIITKSAWILPY